jgi:L-fuconate dehydratase
MIVITALETRDVRFPTSTPRDGSDAMNVDPDYSAAYVILRTNSPDGLCGYGFVFTIGRGNDVQKCACEALAYLVVGRRVDEVVADLGAFARSLTGDPQLRWLGPEKGVIHMAIGAVINAAWDMAARRARLPLWRFIAGLSPQKIVDQIDFRYITDALTPHEALTMLNEAKHKKAERIQNLRDRGYPAYTTSPGWLGYSDEKLARLSLAAVAEGFRTIKLKVGVSVEDDIRRCRIARNVVGDKVSMAVDADQRWDVGDAIEWLKHLSRFNLAWVEEPTNPDDVLGHAAIRRAVAPVPISTGEHAQDRIIFKELFQASAVDLIQIDATRVGGVNEILAILLMARKFGVRAFPHAGGVGLCELVQHLAMADYVSISGSMEDRAIEYADHLHEHFVNPARVSKGRYVAPTAPGFSAEMFVTSISKYSFPHGEAWKKSFSVEGPRLERAEVM